MRRAAFRGGALLPVCAAAVGGGSQTVKSGKPLVDLHMHSVVSDGTDTPAELLDKVREAGIGLFSLTDHDAVRGCLAVRALLKPGDPRFTPGVEFSCKDELGKYHVLGYAYDPASRSIRSVVELGHSYRMSKLKARLEALGSSFGFRFPAEAEKELYALANPGKPHIANLMVRFGYAESKDRAIRDYLNALRVRGDYVRPEEAIRGILGAGGIPVLAHPCYGDGDQLILDAELEERVDRLMGFGLQGVEAYYSGFPDKLRRQVLEIAERRGLYVTAGSDYHGKNKLVRLGDTGFPVSGPVPAGWERFVSDAFAGK